MRTLIRTVHVLSLGIWAGAGAFFNGCVGIKIFAYFASLETSPTPGLGAVDHVLATRMAGELISTIFPIYFSFTTITAFLALMTAIVMARGGARLARVRAWILVAACLAMFIEIAVLYPMSHDVRRRQYAAYDAGRHEEAETLRRRFFALHGPSLLLDISTTLLAIVALGLTAPAMTQSQPNTDLAVNSASPGGR